MHLLYLFGILDLQLAVKFLTQDCTYWRKVFCTGSSIHVDYAWRCFHV